MLSMKATLSSGMFFFVRRMLMNILATSRLDFSIVDSPPRKAKRDSCPGLSLGGNPSKRRLSHEAKGSSSRPSFKQRKMPSAIPSDYEKEEATEEIPSARRPSRRMLAGNEYPLSLSFLLVS